MQLRKAKFFANREEVRIYMEELKNGIESNGLFIQDMEQFLGKLKNILGG